MTRAATPLRLSLAAACACLLLLARATPGCYWNPNTEATNPKAFRILAIHERADGSRLLFEDRDAHFNCLAWRDPDGLPAGYQRMCSRYALVGSKGLVVTFPSASDVREGRTAAMGQGGVAASFSLAPGAGWLSITDVIKVALDSQYFYVDVAGGFDLQFGDEHFTHGLFYSLEAD
jgi:hypothetical protein